MHNLELHNLLLETAKEAARIQKEYGGINQLEDLITHVQEIARMAEPAHPVVLNPSSKYA